MRASTRNGQTLAFSLLVLFGPFHTAVKADPYIPLTYNLTYLTGTSAANFDQSGNVIAERTPYLSETYVTSGPNAGQVHVFTTTSGQGTVIYQVDSRPSFNPGPLPGEQASAVIAGNSSGQEIGVSFPENSSGGELGQHGYLYSGGQLIPLPAFDGTLNSTPRAINQVGQVVGVANAPGSLGHAFLSSDGKMIDLGTLGGPTSYALNLNNKGQVVGFSDTTTDPLGNDPQHAFVYENGSMYDLNKLLTKPNPNILLSTAIAINDLGQIIARADGWSGQPDGLYLLTPSDLSAPPPPIPEPSTLTLFGFMILATCSGRIGRRARGSRGMGDLGSDRTSSQLD